MTDAEQHDGINEAPDYWEIAERVLDGFYRVTVDGIVNQSDEQPA